MPLGVPAPRGIFFLSAAWRLAEPRIRRSRYGASAFDVRSGFEARNLAISS